MIASEWVVEGFCLLVIVCVALLLWWRRIVLVLVATWTALAILGAIALINAVLNGNSG